METYDPGRTADKREGEMTAMSAKRQRDTQGNCREYAPPDRDEDVFERVVAFPGAEGGKPGEINL